MAIGFRELLILLALFAVPCIVIAGIGRSEPERTLMQSRTGSPRTTE